MSYADQQYHTLLQELVDLAESTPATTNRTDTDAFTLFGRQMRFDLSQGFPLLTTKKVHFNSVLTELLWFLKGDTNIKYLLEHNNHIWTDWRFKAFNEYRKSRNELPVEQATFESLLLNSEAFAKEWGSIGKGYGHQWRNFGAIKPSTVHSVDCPDGFELGGVKGFDQISWVINEIKTNPKSRRLIVSGWNPHEVDKVDLPPCHTLFQFHVEPMTLNERKRWVDKNYPGQGPQAITDYVKAISPDTVLTFSNGEFDEQFIKVCDFVKAPSSKLSCQLYQRSADVFLGVPFNIASYALLTQMIAQVCGLGLGEFIWTGGNVHLYENHLTQASLQLSRDSVIYPAPKLAIDTEGKTIFEITEDDVHLEGYVHFPPIKAPVAV